MPKAAICELSLIYPIKTILAMLALQQRPAALHPNRISYPIFDHSGSQRCYKILPLFHPALIFSPTINRMKSSELF
jgi:hypothetical protein